MPKSTSLSKDDSLVMELTLTMLLRRALVRVKLSTPAGLPGKSKLVLPLLLLVGGGCTLFVLPCILGCPQQHSGVMHIPVGLCSSRVGWLAGSITVGILYMHGGCWRSNRGCMCRGIATNYQAVRLMSVITRPSPVLFVQESVMLGICEHYMGKCLLDDWGTQFWSPEGSC